jgi:hypothetical protein
MLNLLAKARWFQVESPSRFSSLFRHDLSGKPVSTFPDHALVGTGARCVTCLLVNRSTALHERPHINRVQLAGIAIAVALAGSAVLYLQVRDRWNSPEIKSPEQAEHTMTGEAARSAGAQIQPTDPKLDVEPTPPGPKQAQPANPD